LPAIRYPGAGYLKPMSPSNRNRICDLYPRWSCYIQILPGSLQSSGRPYPPLSSLLGPLREAAGSVLTTDATSLAERAGSPRALNVVMLGMLAASGSLPFPGGRILDVILEAAPPALVEVHRDAFRLGEGAVKKVGAP